MVYPAGVITVTLTFGPYIDSSGEPLKGTISVAPNCNKLWSSNGTVIFSTPIMRELDESGVAVFFLPATDQAGYTNGTDPITSWYYEITTNIADEIQRYYQMELPASGAPGATFDFDLLNPVPGF